MDHVTSEDRGALVDIESGGIICEEGTSQDLVRGYRQTQNLLSGTVDGLSELNLSVRGESGINCYGSYGEPIQVQSENIQVVIGEEDNEEQKALLEKKYLKKKHKKTNYKKAPKPPRPPRGPSLDAADMLLVKEISAHAMKKRARSERIKALRKTREVKSSFSSSKSSLYAMIITVLFFLVICFQGFCSRGNNSVNFHGSPEPATKSLISVQLFDNPSANDDSGLGSSSSPVEHASGSEFQFTG